MGQVATVISSIRPFARVCQGIGRVVGVCHRAGRGGHRLAVADRVVCIGEEPIVRVRGPGQAAQGIVGVGDDRPWSCGLAGRRSWCSSSAQDFHVGPTGSG